MPWVIAKLYNVWLAPRTAVCPTALEAVSAVLLTASLDDDGVELTSELGSTLLDSVSELEDSSDWLSEEVVAFTTVDDVLRLTEVAVCFCGSFLLAQEPYTGTLAKIAKANIIKTIRKPLCSPAFFSASRANFGSIFSFYS